MNIKVTLFEDPSYTNYSFETELKSELEKVGRRVTAVESWQTRERVGFRKKNMIVVDVSVDGLAIEDPDEFNDTIAKAVTQAAENLSFEVYGIE
ncbi:hypothetical protein [Alteribacillus iranensis]|uniref:Uncharacterized protein n=1 Tax=Alteribacillus iranensis TaxID=930128 RepID=A0A1I2D485_9BACI|nr:hypothetical protein [Alteribacillus iranensis]SFE75295.1 hypothetical protein SAMN05192532_103398 [Alteribacillus iranensis]